MSNAFASAIFLARNTDKVQQGDIARTPAVVAQTGSLINKVSKIDSAIGTGTRTAIDAFEKSSAVKFGSKAVEVAGDLVNPLLVAASAYRVATADDKEAALYKETGGMSAMFAAEALMKKQNVNKLVKETSDDVIESGVKNLAKLIKPLEKSLLKSQNKIVKVGTFILSGIAMVGASILGYSVGAEVGKEAIEKKRALFKEDNPSSGDITVDSGKVKEEMPPDHKKLLIES